MQDVWLVVDERSVAINKRKDESSMIVHYNFPLEQVTTSRLGSLQYGFRIACRGDSVDLRVDSEQTVEKWLTTISWNQLVLSRAMQQGAGCA
jgi:hypothetical protein